MINWNHSMAVASTLPGLADSPAEAQGRRGVFFRPATRAAGGMAPQRSAFSHARSSGILRASASLREMLISGSNNRSAFTLIELLVVIAIMLILMALILPATSSLMKSMGMNRAISMITDEMNFARQTAISRNRDVEVRFYRMGSKMEVGNLQYRAYRTLLADGIDPAKAQALSKLKYFPDNVIASGDAAFSTLLDYANSNRSCLVHSNETLPAGSTEYVSFLFRANGGTSLKPVTGTNSLWYLTLQGENVQTNAATGLPDNYFTAEIDPVTGRLRGYRP